MLIQRKEFYGYIITFNHFNSHRSIVSAVTFYLFLSAVSFVLLNIPMEGTPFYFKIRIYFIWPEYGVGVTLINTLTFLSMAVSFIHTAFLDIIIFVLAAMNVENLDIYNFFSNSVFILSFYGLLFLITFLLFRRRKKKKKIYSDYEE